MSEHATNLLAPLEPSETPIAVIVCHGIGQQAQFETLNDVAEAIVRAHQNDWDAAFHAGSLAKSNEPIEFTQSKLPPDDLLPIAQLELTRHSDGRKQMFHLFEIYWAPMTEGVVGFWDVIFFLLKAGLGGLLAASRALFSRFTFGKKHQYAIFRSSGAQLALAFFLIVSCLLLMGSFFLVAASDILGHFRFPLSSHFPIEALRWNLLAAAPFCLVFLSPLLFTVIHQRSQNGKSSAFLRSVNLASVILVFVTFVAFGVIELILLLTGDFSCRLPGAWLRTQLNPILALLHHESLATSLVKLASFSIFLAIGVFTAWLFRFFIVKYVGDVTAYVSANAVNRFWKVRSQIQARALAIGKSVYGRISAENHDRLMYDNIVVVGHSLGTVITYDLLNTLINLEISKVDQTMRDIAKRTRVFLTCGSPLNKIAFLFRFQMIGKKFPSWRELLNNFKQSLIVSHDSIHRLQRWINISCPPDWISGRFTYYELPTEERDLKESEAISQRVIYEVEDKEGLLPCWRTLSISVITNSVVSSTTLFGAIIGEMIEQ